MMWFRLCSVPPGAKDAVTEVAAVRVTTHAPVPVHAPDQPENVFGAVAVSVRVTGVLGAKLAEHPVVEPDVQLIPVGLLVTFPTPLPAMVTVNASLVVKLAVTFAEADKVKLQVPVPEQPPPLQPPK
jgi:hypothetical protein